MLLPAVWPWKSHFPSQNLGFSFERWREQESHLMDPRGLMRQVSTQDIFSPQDRSSERSRATHSHLQTKASVRPTHCQEPPPLLKPQQGPNPSPSQEESREVTITECLLPPRTLRFSQATPHFLRYSRHSQVSSPGHVLQGEGLYLFYS